MYVNRINAVMISMVAMSDIDCRFLPLSCLTKDYKIDICCFSPKHTVFVWSV